MRLTCAGSAVRVRYRPPCETPRAARLWGFSLFCFGSAKEKVRQKYDTSSNGLPLFRVQYLYLNGKGACLRKILQPLNESKPCARLVPGRTILSSMLNNGNMPSIATLERICSGFGITLEQFFATGSDVSSLTERQRNHLSQWDALTPENQHAVAAFIEFLMDQQSSRSQSQAANGLTLLFIRWKAKHTFYATKSSYRKDALYQKSTCANFVQVAGNSKNYPYKSYIRFNSERVMHCWPKQELRISILNAIDSAHNMYYNRSARRR